ncbi:hypothetical protein MMC13_003087, partial [Lambiella insularis]|nr:hypothetical protein [Lambiella insularis]
DPSAFITSARAVSLPIQEITRNSALGSHSPFNPPTRPPAICASTDGPELRIARPRGTSLPTLAVDAPAPVAQPAVQTFGRITSTQGQTMEDGPIGFAITSGGHPKRRSRSADGLYDAVRGQRMPPIQWRQWRRRSDEIKYWRDSIVESPNLKSKFEDDDDEDEENDNTSSPDKVCEDAPLLSLEDVDGVPHEGEDVEDHVNRDTFDFGILTTSMQDQEPTSIEERVVTVEVKLMDLEYAISKIQTQSHPPEEAFTQYQRLSVETRNLSPESGVVATSLGAETMDESNITRQGSQSTQPTSQSSNGSPVERRTRPISSAPTIRPPQGISPVASERDTRQKCNRNSITSLTIDHYTTLINLIRREQAARRQLEDQVSDLQRQITNLKALSPPDSRSRVPQWQVNTYRHTSKEALDHSSGIYTHNNNETDTDDGFQDVYETPIERGEFEGGSFESPFEGEAF